MIDFKEFYKLTKNPFENTPDPKFLYLSDAHEEAISRLLYAIKENKGLAVLSGVYGTGKTLITYAIKEELKHLGARYQIAYIFNPSLDEVELLKEIAYQLGIEQTLSKEKVEVLRVLKKLLEQNSNDGKNTVVIIDEAHSIKNEMVFEELRLLLNFHTENMFLVTLILSGQPELRTRINQLKQLQQRVSIAYYLTPLSADEVYKYINHRLKIAGRDTPLFGDDAITLIYNYSGGIPRRINTLCDLSLIAGFHKKMNTIDRTVVDEIIQDLEKHF